MPAFFEPLGPYVNCIEVDCVGEYTYRIREHSNSDSSEPHRYEVLENERNVGWHYNLRYATEQYEALVRSARKRRDRQMRAQHEDLLKIAMQKNPDCGAF